jgi:hypothetical protein
MRVPVPVAHNNTLLLLMFHFYAVLCAAVLLCRTWLYPAVPPPREYQFHIAWTATLHNTLACLPTGLGKTLIAAVVMYNYYRWFPTVGFKGKGEGD